MRGDMWALHCVLGFQRADVGGALIPLLIRPTTEHILQLLSNNTVRLSRFRHSSPGYVDGVFSGVELTPGL
jgi:hypothetical protein